VAVASAGPYASLHLNPDRCQHPTTQFFTGRTPFLLANQQCQSTEGKALKATRHNNVQITGDRVLVHLRAKFVTSPTDIDAGTTKHSGKLQQTKHTLTTHWICIQCVVTNIHTNINHTYISHVTTSYALKVASIDKPMPFLVACHCTIFIVNLLFVINIWQINFSLSPRTQWQIYNSQSPGVSGPKHDQYHNIIINNHSHLSQVS